MAEPCASLEPSHLRAELANAPEAFAKCHEGRALGGVGVGSLGSGSWGSCEMPRFGK